MNTTQSRPVNGAARPAAIVAFGIAAVSVALVAIVALGGLGGRGSGNGNGGVVIPPSGAPAVPTVTPKPSAKPTSQPTASPTGKPTPAPTDGGSDAMPIKVDLDNVTGADVYVDIVDETGVLVDAESGTPGDGASVGYDTLKVENLDSKTLKLTWSDYPIDSALALTIDRFDGEIRFLLARPEPTGETDAMGFDRELIVTFSEAVSADDVTAVVQEGFDTAG